MSKRNQRRKTACTDLPLPKEMVFSILSRLPAEFLHNTVRYVSKTWFDIIRDPLFIKMQLLHYSDDVGLLIPEHQGFQVRYLQAKAGKIKGARPKYDLTGEILASCQGILLLRLHKGPSSKDCLCVRNCVTKQELMLPNHHFTTTCKELGVPWAGFSRVPQSGALKVIFPCKDFDDESRRHWHILTVGTDMSWRKIECNFTKDEFATMSNYPISINGIIYWPRRGKRDSKFPAVDLSDESIHWIQVPNEFLSRGRRLSQRVPSTYGLLKLGNDLSCIAPTNHMQMNVWILKDMLTSKWVKNRTFNCNVQYGKLTITASTVWFGGRWAGYYSPMAWLEKGRYLVFNKFQGTERPSVCIVYNLATGGIRYIRNVALCASFVVVEHTSSLAEIQATHE